MKPATDTNFEVATRGVEDIVIDTGAGADVVVVSGNLGGTGLATSTITIDGGTGADADFVYAGGQTVAAGGLTSNHGIVFYGRDGNDFFEVSGAGGNDTFDGGDGLQDTISFRAFGGLPGGVGVNVDLLSTIAQNTNDGLDTILNVEAVAGSRFIDFIAGDANDNFLFGLEGNDTLVGRGGDDFLSGNEGTDQFFYQAGDGTDIVDGGVDGDGLDITTTAGRDYVHISPNLDADGRLDIDIDVGSAVDVPADLVELDVTAVELITVSTGDESDHVDISGNLAGAGIATLFVGVGLNLGAGDDEVVVGPTAGAAINVEIAGEAGADIVDADQSGYRISFTAGTGNDTFRSGFGDDRFLGGADNDISYYEIGDGQDTIDGGTGTDLQNIAGTSASETFNVNLIALSGVDHVGINIESGIGPASEVLADDPNYEVATVNVEDIFIDTGAGADNVIVTGSLDGTGLAQSTITVDTGSGDDTLDLRDRTSPHRVVADGKANDASGDTVVYGFTRASVTSVTQIFDTDGVTVIGAAITHTIGGISVTDELTNFENFTFSDGTLDLTDVFNRPPNAVDDTLANQAEDTPIFMAASDLTGNDSDPDGNPFSVVSVQGAAGGFVSLVGGFIFFTAGGDYVGAASFTYTIRDTFGATDTATVNFNFAAGQRCAGAGSRRRQQLADRWRRLSDDLHPGRRCRSHRRQRHPHHRRGW